MINPFKEINWNPDLKERRKFALSLMIGFPIIAIIFALIGWIESHTWKPFFLWLGLAGFGMGIILRLLPQIARPFYVVWYGVACCMGIVVGNILLGMFYYLIVTPLGIGLRLSGRKAFRKGVDRKCATYWQDAEKVIDLKRYYRQF